MAKSKKPRKQHSTRKAIDRLAFKAAQGSFLINVQGLGEKGQIWVLNNIPVPRELWNSKMYQKPFNLSFMTPRKWHLTSGAACRTPDGKFYVKYFSQQANNEFIYFDPQIQEWIMQELADIVNDVNKEHILTPFTIMNSNGHTFSEKQILDLMNWMKVDDSHLVQTAFEITKTEVLARQEIKSYPLEKRLCPITVSALRKDGLNDWIDIHQTTEERLKNIKGIGDKRRKAIYDSLVFLALDKELRSQLANLQDYILDISRRSESVEYLEQHIKTSQQMYQIYLEGKKNGLFP